MTLDELDRSLPNRFHDAELNAHRVDRVQRERRLDVVVWVGSMEDVGGRGTEWYRRAEVRFTGLQALQIEPPMSP